MSKKFGVLLAMAFCLVWGTVAFAHTPMCSCFLNDDGTVTCEGGFSDGSSASGVKMTVRATTGDVIQEGKMDELSEFTFSAPEGNYEVVFDAGPGHVVVVKGEEIE